MAQKPGMQGDPARVLLAHEMKWKLHCSPPIGADLPHSSGAIVCDEGSIVWD